MPREGKVHLRQDLRELLSLPNMHFEITPIAYGALYEYPYTELIPTFRPYYEEFGAEKFVWARHAEPGAVVHLPAGNRLSAPTLGLPEQSREGTHHWRQRRPYLWSART